MDIHKLKSTAIDSLLSDHVNYLRASYADIIKRNKIGGIFLHRGVVSPKNSLDDYHWPLALTPHYLHWAPDASLDGGVLVTEKDVCLIQIAHDNYWEGPAPKLVSNECYEKKRVLTLDEISFPTSTVFVGDDLEVARALGLSIATESLLADLNKVRTRKTAYELKCIIEATEKALGGHKMVEKKFLNGGAESEFELHLEYLKVTGQTLFATPYQPIVAYGKNAAILHHVYYSEQPNSKSNESLLVDAGASARYYASDITRTYCRGDSADSNLFRGLIKELDFAQQKIASEFIVGTLFEDLHDRTHLEIAKILLSCEILQNISAEDAVSSQLTRIFLPHGLGHSLGIQVHDVGLKTKKPATKNPFLRNTSVVEEGQVCTIEPGIYFIDSLLAAHANNSFINWEVVEKLKKFGGIRIEDNIYADAKKPINLTRM